MSEPRPHPSLFHRIYPVSHPKADHVHATQVGRSVPRDEAFYDRELASDMKCAAAIS